MQAIIGFIIDFNLIITAQPGATYVQLYPANASSVLCNFI